METRRAGGKPDKTNLSLRGKHEKAARARQRQTDRQTDTHRQRDTERHRDKQRERERERERRKARLGRAMGVHYKERKQTRQGGARVAKVSPLPSQSDVTVMVMTREAALSDPDSLCGVEGAPKLAELGVRSGVFREERGLVSGVPLRRGGKDRVLEERHVGVEPQEL